jgi:integrase
MLSWGANECSFPRQAYDGTISGLARRYFSDEFSPYRKMKWNSQIHHDKCGKIIVATVGARQIGKLLGPDFQRWYANWGAPGGEAKAPRPWRAKHCIDTVRRMIAYGVTLGYDNCIRADIILGKLRFPTPPARRSHMTFDQMKAVRNKAHEMGLGSIALATVLQFELSLRQKDVIGEWGPAPLSKGGIVHRGRRWASGLQWSDIDQNMVLRKTHTKTGAYVEFDLKLYPLVIEEINCLPREKRIGPMILSEHTGEPYKHRTFTQTWRRVADRAGLPKAVWNMDARAGAISEAYEAGAGETDVMKHAGHKNRQTSARYNRGTLEQTSRVARLRLAKRSENKS